jgi:hypothetical protein
MTPTIDIVPIERLHPDPANPRRISEGELDVLTRSMRTFGVVQPVLARRGGRLERRSEWGTMIASASWSPAGPTIAFSSLAEPSVSVVDADHGAVRQLAATNGSTCCPVWSPDGSDLLVQRGPGQSRDLWITDLDGEALRQVTHEAGDYFGAAWGH